MSKLAIVLCLAAFVAASNALFNSNRLEQAQQSLNTLIDSTVAQVRSTVSDAKKKSEALVAELEAKAKEYREQVVADVNAKLDKAIADVKLLTEDVRDADLTECMQLGEHVHQLARAALVEVKKCFVDKREKAAGYVENMFKVADRVLGELNVYKAEAHECIDSVDGILSVGKALLCTNGVAAKAVWSAAKAVPSVSIEGAKLTFLLTTLPTTLTYCTTTSAVATFYYEVSVLASKTSKCVEQKIQEIRDSVNQHPHVVPGVVPSERPEVVTEASSPAPTEFVTEASTPAPTEFVTEASTPVPTEAATEASSPVPEVSEEEKHDADSDASSE